MTVIMCHTHTGTGISRPIQCGVTATFKCPLCGKRSRLKHYLVEHISGTLDHCRRFPFYISHQPGGGRRAQNLKWVDTN
jgi:hypothetical protein